MKYNKTEEITKAGFIGFKKISELFEDGSAIPRIKGVYLVLYIEQKPAAFLQPGSGGFFKGKNPNVSIAVLKDNWVDDTIVVYIGKAGKDGINATLHSRLRQYFGFGQGRNIGHWGGRLIWQLKNSKDLVVCWKELPNDDPGTIEAKLIQEFKSEYKKRPFANLKD